MAYEATVTLAIPHGVQVAPNINMIMGSVDITKYHSTLVALTDISGAFRGGYAVILSSITDNGYYVSWVAASNSIKAWRALTAAAATQAANDLDVGKVAFVAFGVV